MAGHPVGSAPAPGPYDEGLSAVPVLLFVLFILVPIAELYVIVQVGQSIGVPLTLALLVADSLLGAWLLRREGARAWTAFRAALDARRLPAREVADGALVLFGGALLLTPGFLSDLLGLLCLLPPSRAVLRRLLTTVVASRLGVVGLAGSALGRAARTRPAHATPRPSPYDSQTIDGEVVDGDVNDGRAGPGKPSGPPP